MERNEIGEHWTNWAITYGTELRATTKSWTAKVLEIDALARRIRDVVGEGQKATVLEVGCGNGANCVELAKLFPAICFDGIDLVPEMVTAARENADVGSVADRVRFFVGDVLKVGDMEMLAPKYDVVFSDRCLINLNTVELQKQAITMLAAKIRLDGHLIMIENSQQTYDEQNSCRTLLGLDPREPADFNLFFDETYIRPHIAAIGLKLIDVEDFISLHDLMLYVLIPAINGGRIDYDHPLLKAATHLQTQMSATWPGAFGTFGQNRLFACHKPA